MGERARHLLVVVVACCLLPAASCSGSGDGTEEAVDTPGAGELRIGVGEDIWPLYGTGPRSHTFAVSPNMNVFEPLVSLKLDYTLRPALAERWEFIEPDTWRFHLRAGVTFHDGRRFSADDVVWTWTERQLLPTSITNTLSPGSVRKVDELTVDFTPTVPNLRLPEQMNALTGAIVPKGSHNDSTPPVGTGPFRVVGYTPRIEAVVERYDGYWGERAKLERLTVRFFADRTARLEALRQNQVDMVLDVSPDDAGPLERERDVEVLRAVGVRQHVLFLNATGEPPAELMADKDVRKAVMLTIDRGAYVKDVLGGLGASGHLVVPAAVLGPAAAAVPAPVHDRAAAGRLLDAAAWRPGTDGVRTKGGRPLHLTLIGEHQLPGGALPFIATQLREVGISTNVKRAEDRLTYDEYRLRPFDIDLKTAGQGNADASAIPAFWLSSQTPEASAFAVGPPADSLIEQARSARTRAGVQDITAALLRLAQEDEAIFTPLGDAPYLYALRKGVKLPNPNPVTQDWSQVTVTR